MTAVMVGDYVGCYMIEKVLKWAFSDYKPKDIAVRRPDQLKREEERRGAALKAKMQAEEEEANRKIEEIERKLREKNLLPKEAEASQRLPARTGRK